MKSLRISHARPWKLGDPSSMTTQQLEPPELTELEKIRQQFDHTPYPHIPLDKSPKENLNELYSHNLVTSYYIQHRKVTQTEGKVILDAGCGAGYKSLVLAEANPGAKIVGIDLSPGSIEVAQARLKQHGFNNAEFHVLLIDQLPQLGLEFDYINCDEVLYLLDDPAAGLRAMKSVLKPNGIIRANLHNAYQRASFFRAQALFRLMGLMDESPKELEHETVIETMKALKNTVKLKVETWGTECEKPDLSPSIISMNHLFVGDTGYTIPDMFQFIEQAGLEFLSMVDWRHWDIYDLFQEPDDLPLFWGMNLANASTQERLHLYELMNPIHRLNDFWCTHSSLDRGVCVDEWEEQDWRTATVHLHPQLRNDLVKSDLLNSIEKGEPFTISQRVPSPAFSPVNLDSTIAACLLPLWQSSQPIRVLVEHYQKIKPINPATLEPMTATAAFEKVKELLNRLDAFFYVLLD
jgi:2-polyprenyl-3-methyl-5-hydroxy-6-metoxy-1,4-benzoquinol methylase